MIVLVTGCASVPNESDLTALERRLVDDRSIAIQISLPSTVPGGQASWTDQHWVEFDQARVARLPLSDADVRASIQNGLQAQLEASGFRPVPSPKTAEFVLLARVGQIHLLTSSWKAFPGEGTRKAVARVRFILRRSGDDTILLERRASGQALFAGSHVQRLPGAIAFEGSSPDPRSAAVRFALLAFLKEAREQM